MRVVRWAEITGPPPDDGGKTQLLQPAAERISGLRRVAAEGSWPVLFAGAEEAFRERPLWLDAQRYADQALAGLGGPYEPVRVAIADELRALLGRLPTLARLSFADGTPLADAETQSWIEAEVLSGGGASSAPALQVAPTVDIEGLGDAWEEARALIKKKRVPEAIACLQRVLDADASPRGRFLARLEIARLLAESGRERLALPLLEDLDAALVRYGLEAWEPGLSLDLLRLLYRCCRRLAAPGPPSETSQRRADEIFDRLCRLDPAQAAALE